MTQSYQDKIAELSAHLLNEAAEKFSNHGCNDLEDGLFDDWTDQEFEQFCKDGADWNNGDLEIENTSQVEDWIAMRVCAYILTKDF